MVFILRKEGEMADAQVKCVLVGDGNVGKTYMIDTFLNDVFPSFNVPTVFNNYTTEMLVDGFHIQLNLWDTAGKEDYDRLRPLSYPGTDVLLVCIDLSNADSLENVKEKWYPEIKHFLPKTPIVLVGAKLDLRNSDYYDKYSRDGYGSRHVSPAQGKALKKDIGAVKYIECSAKTRVGLKDVFAEAARYYDAERVLIYE